MFGFTSIVQLTFLYEMYPNTIHFIFNSFLATINLTKINSTQNITKYTLNKIASVIQI